MGGTTKVVNPGGNNNQLLGANEWSKLQQDMARQSAEMQRSIQAQRQAEIRRMQQEEAKRKQAEQQALQKEQDRIALEKKTASNQAAAQQAAGAMPASVAAIKPLTASKEAPGLSPFGQAVRSGNAFYSNPATKPGGM